MQQYHPDLQAIDLQTRQLEHQRCPHCQRAQFVSHGYVYQKRSGAEPEAVGKRVFCSNRNRRTGCGRTLRLYLDRALRYFHYSGLQLLAFVFAVLTGQSVRQAYWHATRCPEARHAWRWLQRLQLQLPAYRTLQHCPSLPGSPTAPPERRPARHALLASTFAWLEHHFGTPLCCHFQSRLQRPFLP
jgi:hypothetical protein